MSYELAMRERLETRKKESNTLMLSTVSKFYAVRKSCNQGIFYSWEECKNEVKRYTRVEFRSFKVYEEAVRYLEYRLSSVY